MKIANLAVVASALAVATAGCGAPAGSGTVALRQQAAARVPSPAASALDPNVRACGNVETLTMRLRVPMADWYPQGKPFDGKVSAAVADAATAIRREESASSGPARAAIHDWSATLEAMGRAMHGRDKAVVLARTSAAQKSLARMRTACSFHERS